MNPLGKASGRVRLRNGREVRSYEVDHFHGFWNAESHHGSRRGIRPTALGQDLAAVRHRRSLPPGLPLSVVPGGNRAAVNENIWAACFD